MSAVHPALADAAVPPRAGVHPMKALVAVLTSHQTVPLANGQELLL